MAALNCGPLILRRGPYVNSFVHIHCRDTCPPSPPKNRVRSGRDLFRRADWLVHNSTTYIIMHGDDVKQTRPAGMKPTRSGSSVKLQKPINHSACCLRELSASSERLRSDPFLHPVPRRRNEETFLHEVHDLEEAFYRERHAQLVLPNERPR